MSDFDDDWTATTWRIALRSAEDAAANNLKAVLRLADELDRAADAMTASAKERTKAATRARQEARRVRAASYLAQGLTISQTALKAGVSERTVSRWREKS